MQKDSLEALLLRHYGNAAPTPAGLQERLLASVRHEAEETRQERRATAHLREKRLSRRRVVKLVAMGSAGLGILSMGMESLQTFEAALLGQDTTRQAFP
ncbi:MAG: hypothetical protein ACJ788_12260 [Ktedonobacteraceae bacterium]